MMANTPSLNASTRAGEGVSRWSAILSRSDMVRFVVAADHQGHVRRQFLHRKLAKTPRRIASAKSLRTEARTMDLHRADTDIQVVGYRLVGSACQEASQHVVF